MKPAAVLEGHCCTTKLQTPAAFDVWTVSVALTEEFPDTCGLHGNAIQTRASDSSSAWCHHIASMCSGGCLHFLSWLFLKFKPGWYFIFSMLSASPMKRPKQWIYGIYLSISSRVYFPLWCHRALFKMSGVEFDCRTSALIYSDSKFIHDFGWQNNLVTYCIFADEDHVIK